MACLSDTRFIVIDTETTGLPPHGRVVEIALAG
ncbi:exodeoxyribonuclease X [Alicyclobacillus macrosporangiidus]|uniref:Exodeoxyribonuclease X n=1 Tax=Alicyclobacillus macrosporangiidus TaxID=392015 RepID=A0A1I7J9E3_9BACL|nr:exodeoxyribonuclease X [Alicyclobacillus macrosporangiidus]